jgi:hypothetical protein
MRSKLNISLLVENRGAKCVASKMLSIYEGKDCSNTTGLDTTPGEEPQDPDLLNDLSACNVKPQSTVAGVVLPTCVEQKGLSAAQAGSYAGSNYTHDVAASAVNSSDYTSFGAAVTSDNTWFVLILATNTSDGNYYQVSPVSFSSPALFPASIASSLFLLSSLLLL